MQLISQIAAATLLVVAALFPIVNPLGSSVIFLGLTREYPPDVRKGLVRRISINSLLLLIVSMLIGSHVLAFFGVSLPVVQVAGGLVIVSMGWTMLQQRETEATVITISPDEAAGKAFYPLTLPVTVGPGSMSVAVALGADLHKHPYPWMAVVAAALLGPMLVAASVFVCYRSSERLERLLGPTGMSVFLRLSSFIVLCIGIQLLWNGYSALR
jgi:multiple antibiotic resistance protein